MLFQCMENKFDPGMSKLICPRCCPAKQSWTKFQNEPGIIGYGMVKRRMRLRTERKCTLRQNQVCNFSPFSTNFASLSCTHYPSFIPSCLFTYMCLVLTSMHLLVPGAAFFTGEPSPLRLGQLADHEIEDLLKHVQVIKQNSRQSHSNQANISAG